MVLIKRMISDQLPYIGVAKKPFTQWTWTRIDQPIGGPEMLQLPDGRLLGGGRLYLPNSVRTTSLLWIDPKAEIGSHSRARR